MSGILPAGAYAWQARRARLWRQVRRAWDDKDAGDVDDKGVEVMGLTWRMW